MSRREATPPTAGVTLIELLIVIAIVGSVGLLIFKLSANITSFNRFFNNSISVSDKAQKLLRPMAEEIRSASQSNAGSYAIDTALATDFAFYSDIDNDGLAEKVRYYLSGTTLKKDVIKPTGSPLAYNSANKVTTTVVTDVRNGATAIFNYYDSSYVGGAGGEVASGSGAITSIRLVRTTLLIDSDLAMPPPAVTVSTLVAVRNLKQQL